MAPAEGPGAKLRAGFNNQQSPQPQAEWVYDRPRNSKSWSPRILFRRYDIVVAIEAMWVAGSDRRIS